MREKAALLPILVGCGGPPERSCDLPLWYLGAADAVSVVGDWNGWEAGADPLTEVEPGAWTTSLTLPPGDYTYVFLVDGTWVDDALQPLRSFDVPITSERSLLRVEDCAAPELDVSTAFASPDGDLTVVATFWRGHGGPPLDPRSVVAARADGAPLSFTADPATGVITVVQRGLPTGKHTVVLAAADRDGAVAETRVPLWVESDPFLWEDALIYQVVVDRFAGDAGPLDPSAAAIGGRFGGTFTGLADKIEEGWFEALGVNVLWISPVAQNADGAWPGVDGHDYDAYHGYWPVSAEQVEPSFGGEAALVALIEAAHARGMRVLFDLVPNHVHVAHPHYLAHPDWFHPGGDCVCGNYTCPWASDIESCWFTTYLPDYDWTVPGVPDAVVGDAISWAERFDVDGMRVDAVPMMPRSAIRLLVHEASRRLEGEVTRFYALGETYTSAGGIDSIRSNLGPFGLDGQFEFTSLWALRDWAAGFGPAESYAASLDDAEAAWQGSGSIMAPFVSNHDMPRFLSYAAGHDLSDPWGAPPPQPTDLAPYERLWLAYAAVLSLPGAPVILYGDEVGLAGAGDPDCRRPMPWGDDVPSGAAIVGDRLRALGVARRCAPALRHGERLPLLADGSVLAWARDAGDGAPALFVANAGDTSATASFVVPAWSAPAGGFVDVVAGDAQTWAPGAAVALELAPRSARVYLSQSSACSGVP